MTDGTPNFAPGTPSWVDLGSSDLNAAVRFYSDLFGWQSEDMGEQAAYGSDTIWDLLRKGDPAHQRATPVIPLGKAAGLETASKPAEIVIDPKTGRQIAIPLDSLPKPGAARWEIIGPGGGGALFAPVVSSRDPDRAMIASDISACLGEAFIATGGEVERFIR